MITRTRGELITQFLSVGRLHNFGELIFGNVDFVSQRYTTINEV